MYTTLLEQLQTFLYDLSNALDLIGYETRPSARTRMICLDPKEKGATYVIGIEVVIAPRSKTKRGKHE
jgi:hypothetical protein